MTRVYLLNPLGDTNDESLCFLSNPIEDLGTVDVPMGQGKSVAKLFPKDAKWFMSEENPGTVLPSLIGNTQGFLVVARTLKEVVEKHCKEAVEYLPFTLHDHRKRPYSTDYFILHPLGKHACLDLEASEITWSDDQPREVIRLHNMVVDRAKLQGLPQLFRLDLSPLEYLIGYDLAKDIKALNPTNVSWRKLPFAGE